MVIKKKNKIFDRIGLLYGPSRKQINNVNVASPVEASRAANKFTFYNNASAIGEARYTHVPKVKQHE